MTSNNASTPAHSPLSGMLRGALGQSSIYFTGLVVVSLIQFIVIPVFARLFDPATYGVLNLALLAITVGFNAVGSWIVDSATRFLPQYQRLNETRTFYTTLLLSMIMSIVVFLVLMVPGSFLLPGLIKLDDPAVIALIAGTVPFFIIFRTYLSVLRIRQQPGRFVTYNLVSVGAGYALGLLFVVWLDMGVTGILLGQFVILVVLGVLIVRALLNNASGFSTRRASPALIKEFARYGLPATAGNVGTWILSSSSRFVIGFFNGTADVGLFSMGYNIGNLVLMIVQGFALAVIPSLITTYESEHRDMTAKLLRELTRIYFLLGLPAAVGVSVLAQPIIGLLTTEPYYAAASVVPIIAIGNFIYGLSTLAYTGLIMAKKTNIMALNWCAAGVLNIVLNVLLVPHFGYFIAAVSYLLSNIALLFLNMKTAGKYLKWNVAPRSVLNIGLASLIMAGVVLAALRLTDSFILECVIGAAAGVLVYAAMLLALREFSRGETREMISIVKRLLFLEKRAG
jgi:O-antigen/teichoic acid export membrane protein